jgi:hypothetical protein
MRQQNYITLAIASQHCLWMPLKLISMILFHPRSQFHHANYKTATVKLDII